MGRKKKEHDGEKSVLGSVSRRDFLYYCGGLAGSLALVGCGGDDEGAGKAGEKKKGPSAEKVAETLEKAAGKPPVIWLEGQDCAGCSISFLNAEDPPIAEILLDKISLRYHEAVMAASGHVSEKALESTLAEGGYILVVEGSIPGADDRFCTVGGKPFEKSVVECAEKAGAIVALGACATYGGIPGATPSRGMGVGQVVKDKPVINLPMCPAHHDHLVQTLVYHLENEKAPPLDDHGRPKMFYAKTVHDQCERKKHYDEGNYLQDWNDPKQAEWCLAEKGCKGVETYSDCPTRKYNGGVNYCIECGSPCQGCAEPTFYEKHSPLYANNLYLINSKKESAA